MRAAHRAGLAGSYNDPYNYVKTQNDASTSSFTDILGRNVEASIIDCGVGGTAYNGYRFLMAFVPLGSAGLQNLENPSVLFSQDGNLWVPAGVTNPVVGYPGGGAAGNNADPSVFDNRANDGKIYLHWVRENTTPLSASGVFWKSSSNGGLTWTAEAQMLVQTTGGSGNDQHLEPKVEYNPTDGLYHLWYFDTSAGGILGGAGPIMHATSSSPTSGWSTAATCTLTIPGAGRRHWHWGTPRFLRGRWVTGVSDNATNRNIWLISSTDGVTWKCGPRPLISPRTSDTTKWDAGRINRLSVVLADDGLNLAGWYNADTNTADSAWHLSHKIKIPWGEVPI